MNQITKILPRKDWERLSIVENNEPLVLIEENDYLKIGIISKSYDVCFYIRKSVKEKLEKVAKSLPKGFKLVIIEGYRSIENQQKSWDATCENIRLQNPKLNKEEIEQKAGLVTARPNRLANHNCGGAIDVTLCDEKGSCLDMGTPYPSEIKTLNAYKKAYINFPMFPKFSFLSRLTKLQKENRKILREVMEKEGFVWYPGEWWHYCYGDRMWAVYTKQEKCFYGPVDFR
jgi:zinc D-Ala-D-Ala dipeptidase